MHHAPLHPPQENLAPFTGVRTLAVKMSPGDDIQVQQVTQALATPRAPRQVKDNLYRHTNGFGLAEHSGFVLIAKQDTPVIDPAMPCTAGWLRDEIRKRINGPAKPPRGST